MFFLQSFKMLFLGNQLPNLSRVFTKFQNKNLIEHVENGKKILTSDSFCLIGSNFMTWIKTYKEKKYFLEKLISLKTIKKNNNNNNNNNNITYLHKLSINSNVTFSSYAWLCVFHCSHRILYWNYFSLISLKKCASTILITVFFGQLILVSQSTSPNIKWGKKYRKLNMSV